MPTTRRGAAPSIQAVQVWGPEPIGAANADALDAMAGMQLAGMVGPTPLPVGEPGSDETTAHGYFYGVQAFNGGDPTSLSTLHTGNGVPVAYGHDHALAGFEPPSGGTHG